jgi:hypothetical protein
MALLASSAVASAQSATNQAWIGQTGQTNTISITQQGVSNSAGADNTALRINQDGRENAITIDQYGWSNSAGAADLGDASLPEGLDQTGDHNTLTISQRDLVESGFNFVGAVLQISVPGGSALANLLSVIQSGSGGDLGAGHRIGAVTQNNADAGLGENSAILTQTGGYGGDGNTNERLIQEGYANIAAITQSYKKNRVDFARQEGHGNQFTIDQDRGEQNTVGLLDQVGVLNTIGIQQSGNRNYIAKAGQNNDRVAIKGNRMTVTIAGDDNGGDGLGGQGAFQNQVLLRSGVLQGAFQQFGDDNDISFTVNGSDDNRFGIAQFGRGNGAIVAISPADRTVSTGGNEVGLYQDGDGNEASLAIVGSGNVTNITAEGDRNQLALKQTGERNLFDIGVSGSDNNNSAASSVGGFAGHLAVLALNAGLTPGQGLQTGNRNSLTADLDGDANLFAFRQAGDGNAAILTISGRANQAVVNQVNNNNTALVGQSGAGNMAGIVQF